MWPNTRISVMGGEQAAGVLADITRAQHEKAGKPVSPILKIKNIGMIFLSLHTCNFFSSSGQKSRKGS